MTTLHKVRFHIVFYHDNYYEKGEVLYTTLNGHIGGDPQWFYLSCQLKAPLHVFIRMMIIKLVIKALSKIESL